MIDDDMIAIDVLTETIVQSGKFYIRLENDDEYLIKSYRVSRYADGKIEVVFSHLENFSFSE